MLICISIDLHDVRGIHVRIIMRCLYSGKKKLEGRTVKIGDRMHNGSKLKTLHKIYNFIIVNNLKMCTMID